MKTKEKERIMCKAVLCLFLKKNKVLLAKKTKKIGKGKWNGYGGEIEPGENQKQACVREVGEETGGMTVRESDLIKVADAYFHNTTEDDGTFICHVAVFACYNWKGNPSSTSEMIDPTWFKYSKLPLNNMLPADAHWLPTVLLGSKIVVKAKYGPHQEHLIGNMEIMYVDSLPEE